MKMKILRELKLWGKLDLYKNSAIGEKVLHDIYLHTKRSLTTLIVIATILFIFLLDKVPEKILYPWFFLAILININRLYDSYIFLRDSSSKSYEQWCNKFTYKSYFTALVWGIGSFVFLSYMDDYILQNVIFLAIIGIGSGAMVSISPAVRTASIYLFLLISPLFLYFLMQGDSVNYIIAFMLLAYYLLLVNVSQNIGESLIRSYIQEEKYRKSQKELFAKKDELKSLFKNAPIGIMYADSDYNVIDCNVAYADIFKRKIEDLIGINLNDVPDQRPIDALKNDIPFYTGPYDSVLGYELWIEARFSPLLDSNGKRVGTIVLIENKTKEKKAIDSLNYMARHDDLTTLANRRSMMEYMKRLVGKEEHKDHYSILFYLDLNRFKTINDTLGHSVGDQLLIQVAKRLQHLTEEEYLLSRLGGDEFIMVLPFVATNEAEAKNRADLCSRNVHKAFKGAFFIGELHLYVKSSIGIVIIEPGMQNIDEIVRYADIAMYNAKRKGMDTIAYYNAELDERRKEIFGLQHDLYHALESNQFELFYQPIVDIKDDKLKAAEALIRWRHPRLGLLYPGDFIDLAVESGLIDDIGWFVIEQVCRQIGEMKRKSLFLLEYISININAMQFQGANFKEKFWKILDSHNVSPRDIVIEITETSLIDNFEQTREAIDSLRKAGIRCAIDDFGTGYSSLSYLKKFSFSLLKIDREFIKDIPEKFDNMFLVESIIYIGKKLGYRIVIEGIETEEQRSLLRDMDDSLRYQGFLCSPAVPVEAFMEMLKKEV